MDEATIAKRIRDPRLVAEDGTKVRAAPMPKRMAMGDAEIAMLNECLNAYRAEGVDPGYQGVYEKRYTDDFVAMMGGGYADAVSTGSGSIWLAVAALDLPKGSEVICSPITDPGSLAAITMNGLKPRLADAKPGNYNMGSEQVAARLGPNVSAIMAVHASGQATDVDKIVSLAHAKGIKV